MWNGLQMKVVQTWSHKPIKVVVGDEVECIQYIPLSSGQGGNYSQYWSDIVVEPMVEWFSNVQAIQVWNQRWNHYKM
jgi:hypothetical protein